MRTLSGYVEFLNAVLLSVTEKTEFHSRPALTEIVRNPRMVVILNHATPLSWIPAIGLLTNEVVKAGGGDRTPIGIADKWLFSNPFTLPLAQYLTQSDRHLSFDELIEKFQNSEKTDLALMPEGANTFFGNVHEVQKFRSPKFIEIAIRANAPIFIVVHKGSESWSLPIQFPLEIAKLILPYSKFFGEKLMNSEALNLPVFMQKIPRFAMSCELYHPTLKVEDLSDDSSERRQQLEEEGEKIRARMNELLLQL